MHADRQHPTVAELAATLALGSLLDHVRRRWRSYELVDHWQQGEFHHDTVLRLPDGAEGLPGPILVIATNCNGGVKEVLCFSAVPERYALWHARCPDNPEFAGTLTGLVAIARTAHWFDPCELLGPDARSEYQERFRERQCGGGWQLREAARGTLTGHGPLADPSGRRDPAARGRLAARPHEEVSERSDVLRGRLSRSNERA